MKKLMLLFAMVMFSALVYAQAEQSVARHVFTSAIVDREPADQISSFIPAENTSVFHFVEIMNMQNESITVVWQKNGESVYERSFSIGGSRWRINTSMRAEHFSAGDKVVVEVKAADGSVLSSDALTVE